ncbi:hypothetical protein ACFX19_044782 [Malus domestica]
MNEHVIPNVIACCLHLKLLGLQCVCGERFVNYVVDDGILPTRGYVNLRHLDCWFLIYARLFLVLDWDGALELMV